MSVYGNESRTTISTEYESSSSSSSFSLASNVSYEISMSTVEALFLTISLTTIILLTVGGNVMVIISIFVYKPLRNVQNMYLVSLAVADIAVALFVMPLSIAYAILDKWIFGVHICEMWLTFDVLCCTASILNLCAIALDRYRAIYDPINYAQQRTMRHVLYMISLVWIISAVISVPPLIGWNDWPEYFEEDTPCKLSEAKGYVIYSSLGSFYIPLVIMTVVYVKIFQATRQRLRDRAKAAAQVARLNVKNGQNHASLPIETSCFTQADTGSSTYQMTTDLDNEQSVQDSVSTSSKVPKGPTAVKERLVCEDNGKGVIETSIASTTNNVQQYWEEKQKISLSKERRAARILGIVMGVFVASWLPFFIMYVVIPFCDTCNIPKAINAFITWLGYVNSSLNPVIYTIFNVDFRRSFHKLLCCERL